MPYQAFYFYYVDLALAGLLFMDCNDTVCPLGGSSQG